MVNTLYVVVVSFGELVADVEEAGELVADAGAGAAGVVLLADVEDA